MRTELVRFSKEMPTRLAGPGAIPGALPDGSVVCAIDNCPDGVSVDDLTARLRGLFPADGVIRVDFADLPAAKSGNCCGGACGG